MTERVPSESFRHALEEAGVGLYTGVPDSLLKEFSSLKQSRPRQIFRQVAGHQVNPKRTRLWLHDNSRQTRILHPGEFLLSRTAVPSASGSFAYADAQNCSMIFINCRRFTYGLGWASSGSFCADIFRKGKPKSSVYIYIYINILIQKTFLNYNLKAKGARNIRELQRKTAHCSRQAQNVINYVSIAPARADRESDPLEKQTKAKKTRHANQNDP